MLTTQLLNVIFTHTRKWGQSEELELNLLKSIGVKVGRKEEERCENTIYGELLASKLNKCHLFLSPFNLKSINIKNFSIEGSLAKDF